MGDSFQLLGEVHVVHFHRGSILANFHKVLLQFVKGIRIRVDLVLLTHLLDLLGVYLTLQGIDLIQHILDVLLLLLEFDNLGFQLVLQSGYLLNRHHRLRSAL